MVSSRHRFSEKTREPGWVQDWVDAELVERGEAIKAQIAILDEERAELETEFFKRIEAIESQVESLDNERDGLELNLYVQQRLVAHEEAAPSAPTPGQILALVTLILGPWILIGAIVWLLVG